MTNQLFSVQRAPLLFVAFALLSVGSPFESPCSRNLVAQDSLPPMTAKQWKVKDLRFQSAMAKSVDVEFSVQFTHVDGTSLEVPGFYDGDGDYVARFTAPRSGSWSFVTQSSVKDLNDRKGRIEVDAADKDSTGGVVVDPDNRRRFRYQNGRSYYPIAIECDWLFALDADNPNDIPDTRKFVDTLASNGFNQVVLNVFAYDVAWKKDDDLDPKFDYGSRGAFPFGGSNDKPDHDALNIPYFQRLDRVIEYLDQKGIVAHLMIYVWNKRVNWPESNSQADNRYFDYVVRRYQAYPNLIWDISKEALGYGHNDVNYISNRIDRLRILDAYQRLVTVHDFGYCKRFPKKVDFMSVQIWASELYSVMRKIYTDMPGKPVLNIEHGGYEKSPYVVFTGSYTSPEVCLERAYQCVFAGTYPTHYWQGAAWNVIIPDINVLDPIERPRLDYYRHMRSIVEKYDFASLKAGEKKSSSGFCLHNGKDLFVYYVPKENINIGVRLPKHLKGGTMTGTWFNPYTGEFQKPTEQKISQWPSFDKPFDGKFGILIVHVNSKPEHKSTVK